MKYLLVSCLALFIISGCNDEPVVRSSVKAEVNRVLDNWHNAAAESYFERYFNHFINDSAIFMGTDATEYWNVPEFKDYARDPFARNSGWKFVPVRRHIYISESGKTAWFDEALDSEAFGLARGSGVLVKADTTWKIAHYNLSIPIPNSIVYDVVDRIQTAEDSVRSIE